MLDCAITLVGIIIISVASIKSTMQEIRTGLMNVFLCKTNRNVLARDDDDELRRRRGRVMSLHSTWSLTHYCNPHTFVSRFLPAWLFIDISLTCFVWELITIITALGEQSPKHNWYGLCISCTGWSDTILHNEKSNILLDHLVHTHTHTMIIASMGFKFLRGWEHRLLFLKNN